MSNVKHTMFDGLHLLSAFATSFLVHVFWCLFVGLFASLVFALFIHNWFGPTVLWSQTHSCKYRWPQKCNSSVATMPPKSIGQKPSYVKGTAEEEAAVREYITNMTHAQLRSKKACTDHPRISNPDGGTKGLNKKQIMENHSPPDADREGSHHGWQDIIQ